MKANPGGQISPSEVIGRDQLIRHLWGILERQSLVMSAERRMGKTSVIKKMEAESPSDKLVIYRDLEGLRTPLEFVETVFQDVEKHLSTFTRGAYKARKLLQQLNSAEFSGFKMPDVAAQHWKTILTKTVEDLVEHQECPLIFFWDEMPMMLENIKRDSGEKLAMEVLDTLRSLRQTYPSLRMVYTGSIGLHHVISSLKQAGYANAPTNDMYIQDIGPISSEDGRDLARQLLEGERILVKDHQAVAEAIARCVDCVPYYIHHVIDQLKWWDGEVNVASVSKIVDSSLIDPLNRWDMAHYRERINIYYESTKQVFALGLLDILSITDKPLLFRELFDQLKLQVACEDAEAIRDVLTLLKRDHYIDQQENRAYKFRFSLIERYWRLSRGLGE